MSTFEFAHTRLSCALAGFALLILFACVAPAARGQSSSHRGFWVAGSAETTVKADEAIIVLAIEGSAPDATDAYAQNETMTDHIAQVLDDLGLTAEYRFSSDRFESPALTRTPATPFLQARAIHASSFAVTKYVFVTFGGPEVSGASFDQKLASTVASLTANGATAVAWPPGLPAPGRSMQSAATVIFTVKDPGPVLSETTNEAIRRAQTAGKQTAKQLHVHIKGILDARINRPLEIALPRQQDLSIADELNLRYYSTSRNVTIPATCAIEFAIR